MMRYTPYLASALVLTLVAGCSPATHSQQMVDARRSFKVAEGSHAADHSPDELLEAENLLEKADAQKDGSPEEVHFAYLADRQARMAISDGAQKEYMAREAASEEEYLKLQEARGNNAEESLARTQEHLEEVSRALGESDADVVELEERKQVLLAEKRRLEEELGISEQGRKDAEAKASAAMASLKELAQVKEEAQETRITLSGAVLFKTNVAELLPIAESTLSNVADALKGMPEERTVVIEGHTDSRGTEEHNTALSKERAQVVRDFLVKQGVTESRLKAVGRGEADPIAKNDTAEGRANNRRVELIVKKVGDEDGKRAAK